MNDNKKVQGIDRKIWELSDEIVLPINVFIYLANDRAYNNPQRLSKIQAFVDLVEHYLDSLQNEQDAALNIAKLSRRWNWTRPTVIAYVNNLKAMNAFEVKDSKEGKNVSINPNILSSPRWGKASGVRESGDSLQSRPTQPHLSSDETEENSVTEK